MADKNTHETPILVGIVLFVLFLVCVLFWMAMSTEISSGVRWIRVGQLMLINVFTDNEYGRDISALIKAPANKLTLADLGYMTQIVAQNMRYPIGGVLVIMSVIAFMLKQKHPYSRTLDLEGLAREQADAFPVTAPILKFNPLKANFRAHGNPVPEKLPMFAEALTPDEWVSHNSVPLIDGTIDRETARRAFAKQLCGRWKGVSELPWYAKALFAAFAMKAGGKRTEADEFLGQISLCWEPKRGLQLTPDLRKQILEIIKDPRLGRVLEKIAAQHFFVAPALARCLAMAREQGGVLAPAQFLWLRGVDRHMWYTLNNLGRAAVHMESAGAIAHYRAEKSAGKPIPNPQVDIAVDGLMDYLKENFITQFPAKEYTR